MNKILCIALIPFGVALSIWSAIKGWDNGKFWWILWADFWADRPDSIAIQET